MKKIFLVMIIGILAGMQPAWASLILTADTEVTPSQLVPGSNGHLKLTINNVGDADLPVVYVQLVSLEDPLVLEDTAGLQSSYIGGIKAGASTEKIYKFTVPAGSPSRTYSAQFKVTQSAEGETNLMVSGYILIPVQAQSSLIVKSLSPTTFRPGEQAQVEITLSNGGDVALNDLVVSWTTTSDLILPFGSDNKANIDSLEPNAEAVVPMNLIISPSTSSGVYPFQITTSYYDQTGTEKTANSTIGILVEKLTERDLSISLKPSSFAPSETAAATFEITNIGDTNLNDLSITWTASGDVILPLGLGNTLSVKSLNAGESVQKAVQIIVDKEAVPAIYPISIQVTYSDDKGIQKTDNFTLGVLIGGTTDFQVGLQEVSGRTTSLSIGNIGVNPARAITVTIPPQEGFSASGPSEVFVGNLDPGDFTVAGFQLNQNQQGANLMVVIAYTDASGNRQTIEKELALNDAVLKAASTGEVARNQGFMPHDRSQSGLQNIAIGIVGIVIIAVLFLIWSRKKKK